MESNPIDSVFWFRKKFFDFCLFVIETRILVLIPWKNSWKSNLWKDNIVQVWDIACKNMPLNISKVSNLSGHRKIAVGWERSLYNCILGQ